MSVANTIADQGLMGPIPAGTWLPALPYGYTVGPKPGSMHQRYLTLYRTFANAWRVTDENSLFKYAPGTSTAAFTDLDWPAEKLPCKVKKGFEIPGAKPPLVNISQERAEAIAKPLTFADLFRNCVFDIRTTGDETLVKSYLAVQDLRLHGSTVQIVGDKLQTGASEPLAITAIVSSMSSGRPTPAGSVTFLVDSVAAGRPVKLDERGRAHFTTNRLGAGTHMIRAAYTPGGGKDSYYPSTSRNLLHTVEKRSRY